MEHWEAKSRAAFLEQWERLVNEPLPGGRIGLCKAVCRGKIWAAPLKGQNAHKEWAHSIFFGAVPNGSFPRLVPAGVSEYNMFCFFRVILP